MNKKDKIPMNDVCVCRSQIMPDAISQRMPIRNGKRNLNHVTYKLAVTFQERNNIMKFAIMIALRCTTYFKALKLKSNADNIYHHDHCFIIIILLL